MAMLQPEESRPQIRKSPATEAAGHSRFSSLFSLAARGGKRPGHTVVIE
jgi:hypothetical protein